MDLAGYVRRRSNGLRRPAPPSRGGTANRRDALPVTPRQGVSLGKNITPHTLRHAFITAALDAGVPLRNVQEAASDADPRTTVRYDRARVSLDRHATYVVTAFLAGAAR